MFNGYLLRVLARSEAWVVDARLCLTHGNARQWVLAHMVLVGVDGYFFWHFATRVNILFVARVSYHLWGARRVFGCLILLRVRVNSMFTSVHRGFFFYRAISLRGHGHHGPSVGRGVIARCRKVCCLKCTLRVELCGIMCFFTTSFYRGFQSGFQ